MKFSKNVVAIMCLGVAAMLAGPASATVISYGDLGNNVIDDAGQFVVNLNLAIPDNLAPATLDVTYGLWNSPPVLVDVFINAVWVGDFFADSGYISPGPAFAAFDVTGLLLTGVNTIVFDGFGQNNGAYVIGQVDLTYSPVDQPVPEPATMVLLGLGLAGFAARARRREKAE